MVATVELVGGGTVEVDAVGGGGGGSVVGGGGGSVAGGEVAGGGVGADVAGGAVPVLRGAVVTTGVCVVTTPPAAVVDVGATDEDVELLGPIDVVVTRAVVVVARTVVDGDWVATCCWGDVSLPVATSNSRAAKAIDARAYSPTLKR